MAAKSKPTSQRGNRSTRHLALGLIPQQESLPRRGLPFMKSSRQGFFWGFKAVGTRAVSARLPRSGTARKPRSETRQLQISEQAAPFCFIPSSSRSEHFIFWNSSFEPPFHAAHGRERLRKPHRAESFPNGLGNSCFQLSKPLLGSRNSNSVPGSAMSALPLP